MLGGKRFDGVNDTGIENLGAGYGPATSGLTLCGWVRHSGALGSASVLFDFDQRGSNTSGSRDKVDFQKRANDRFIVQTRAASVVIFVSTDSAPYLIANTTTWYPWMVTLAAGAGNITVYFNSSTAIESGAHGLGSIATMQYVAAGFFMSTTDVYAGQNDHAHCGIWTRVLNSTEIGHFFNDFWDPTKIEQVAGTDTLLWWSPALTKTGTQSMANPSCDTNMTFFQATDLDEEPNGNAFVYGGASTGKIFLLNESEEG